MNIFLNIEVFGVAGYEVRIMNINLVLFVISDPKNFWISDLKRLCPFLYFYVRSAMLNFDVAKSRCTPYINYATHLTD